MRYLLALSHTWKEGSRGNPSEALGSPQHLGLPSPLYYPLLPGTNTLAVISAPLNSGTVSDSIQRAVNQLPTWIWTLALMYGVLETIPLALFLCFLPNPSRLLAAFYTQRL